ncbi:MAG: serine hydrolase [Flavobacteriales bacterium]|nr:serine hydrolase [Flavobacteriales bacterium]
MSHLTKTNGLRKDGKPKRIIQIVLLLGTAISLFFVPWVIVKAWLLPLPETLQEQADEAVAYGFEGIVVYVDKNGEPPAFYTAGWHDRMNKIPAKKDAYFKIGSIGKLYDAVAIAKLVGDGRLDLNKTLADYLPELAGRIENAEKITLKMLVQHRSGIPNYTDTRNYWAHPKETAEENLQLILDQPANFEPDKDYEYCNTNYLLLNRIMDRSLGYANFQFIQERVLTPLKLNNTFTSINDVDIEDVMSGFHKGHDADLKTDDIGMIATAEDVGIFLRALNNGNLLTEKEQKIYSSIYKYEHAGWVPGYQSFATYNADLDAIIVTFYSTTDPDLILWNLAEIINGRFAKIIRKEST